MSSTGDSQGLGATLKIEKLLANRFAQLSSEAIRRIEQHGCRIYLRSHMQTDEPSSVDLSLGNPFDNGVHDGFEQAIEEHSWSSSGQYLGRKNYWATWVGIQSAPSTNQPMSHLLDGLRLENYVDEMIQRYEMALSEKQL